MFIFLSSLPWRYPWFLQMRTADGPPWSLRPVSSEEAAILTGPLKWTMGGVEESSLACGSAQRLHGGWGCTCGPQEALGGETLHSCLAKCRFPGNRFWDKTQCVLEAIPRECWWERGSGRQPPRAERSSGATSLHCSGVAGMLHGSHSCQPWPLVTSEPSQPHHVGKLSGLSASLHATFVLSPNCPPQPSVPLTFPYLSQTQTFPWTEQFISHLLMSPRRLSGQPPHRDLRSLLLPQALVRGGEQHISAAATFHTSASRSASILPGVWPLVVLFVEIRYSKICLSIMIVYFFHLTGDLCNTARLGFGVRSGSVTGPGSGLEGVPPLGGTALCWWPILTQGIPDSACQTFFGVPSV